MTRAALVIVALAACGGAKPAANGGGRGYAYVVVRSNVGDAQLYVDGRFVAPLDALGGGIAIAPGSHRFELRHDDFFSNYLELTLADAERKKLSLDLAPVLP